MISCKWEMCVADAALSNVGGGEADAGANI